MLPAMAVTLVVAGCSSTGPTGTSITLEGGTTYGASQFKVTITPNGAELRMPIIGACFILRGTIAGPIPYGAFSLTGRFWRLSDESYPARFMGSRGSSELLIKVFVPYRADSYGPFVLTRGPAKTWPDRPHG